MADDDSTKEEKQYTFEELGLLPVLCETCARIGYTAPTKIQVECLPYALKGRDILGIAHTGSGKTAAFALPVLQDLLKKSIPFHTVVISPTRELALQISEHFNALGSVIGLRVCKLVGGDDIKIQAKELGKKPHVIVGTPGRVRYHLEKTKFFNVRSLKYLILDEADMLLTTEFEIDVDKIIQATPPERRTFLFSATMTDKVDKLQRVSLKNPVRLELSTKFETVKTLKQNYIFIPFKHKDCYLVYLLHELVGNSVMVFASAKKTVSRLSLILASLGFNVAALHGNQTQMQRLETFAKFRSKTVNVMISTNIASRGLDISHVDTVINYDLSRNPKDYIHRVGRTARAGASGCAISIVTQYDLEVFLNIETHINQKMELYNTDEDAALVFLDRVAEAQRIAMLELKELEKNNDDEENQTKSKKRKAEPATFQGRPKHKNKRR